MLRPAGGPTPAPRERQLVARRPSGALDPRVDGPEGVRECPAGRPGQGLEALARLAELERRLAVAERARCAAACPSSRQPAPQVLDQVGQQRVGRP